MEIIPLQGHIDIAYATKLESDTINLLKHYDSVEYDLSHIDLIDSVGYEKLLKLKDKYNILFSANQDSPIIEIIGFLCRNFQDRDLLNEK